jgi:catechol 2,3-dioxygenase-like lactoylglutathione lyase family enzyme
MNLNHVTVPVTAIDPAVAFYKLLGLKLIVLNGHYARFELPDGDATFSVELAAGVAQGGDVPRICFECDDLDEQTARLQAAGVTFEQAPTDMPWQWREAHLRDPSGNLIYLYRAGSIRKHPPWRLADAG